MSARGTIKRDEKRGTWMFVVDTRASDGKRRQVFRRGFATKKAAAVALAEIVANDNRGTFSAPRRGTVATFLRDEWLPAKRPTVKPSTAASYAGMITAYIVPAIGSMQLAKVDGGVLNSLYASLLADGRTGASGKTGGLSPKTVRNIHGLLHRAFKDATRWGRLPVNPCDAADQPRNNPPEMLAWSTDELRAFVAFVANDRMAAVWRLAATTGVRRGELLGLRWSDVDLDAGTIAVRQTVTMVDSSPEVGTPKSRAGSRTIALDDGTAAVLRTWKRAQTAERLLMGPGWQDVAGMVVTDPDGSPIHPQVFTRRFGAVAKRAGLRRIRLHDVRHSYATASLRAGVNVKVLSQRIGHADVSVTLKVYHHVLPGDDEAAAATAAAAIFG